MTDPKSLSFLVDEKHGSVSALLLRPAQATALLVLSHGAGTDMRHSSMVSLALALHDRGVATFRYNFPYKEKGSGPPNSKPTLTATVRAAVAAATAAAPNLPLFAGGRSFGGRMTSLAASEAPLSGVKGIIFFAFPLHPAGKPSTERAEHLAKVTVPMLFLQGPRDSLATPELLKPVVRKLGAMATLHEVAYADHSFKVLKSSGRRDPEVLEEVAVTTATWIAKHLK
jgi:predicted alpha/beta-hydrolase family hydrolase